MCGRSLGDLWCAAPTFYPDENLMKIINDEPNESWDDPDIPRDKWFLDLRIFNGPGTTNGDWRWLAPKLDQLIKTGMKMIGEEIPPQKNKEEIKKTQEEIQNEKPNRDWSWLARC